MKLNRREAEKLDTEGVVSVTRKVERREPAKGKEPEQVPPPRKGSEVRIYAPKAKKGSKPKVGYRSAVVAKVMLDEDGNVWNITLVGTATTEKARYPAAQSEMGYASDHSHALTGTESEPEAKWQTAWAEESWVKQAEARERRQSELDEMPLPARLRHVESLERQGGNVGRELRAIRSQVAAAERKLGLREVA